MDAIGQRWTLLERLNLGQFWGIGGAGGIHNKF